MFSDAWKSLADWTPVVIPVIASIGAVVTIIRQHPRNRGRSAEIVLLWYFGGVVGVGGLVLATSHLFNADVAARQIGFPEGNPFQYEVALANLAFAVLGLLCLHFRDGFWEATAIGFAVYYWGAAIGHFIEILAHENYAPFNAGPILITVVGAPAVIFFALRIFRTATTAHNHDGSLR